MLADRPDHDRPTTEPTRVSMRELGDFLTALRENPTATGECDRSALLAWKSSLLDRIADQTTDPETRAVAAAARADLAAARADAAAGRAVALAKSFELRTGGAH